MFNRCYIDINSELVFYENILSKYIDFIYKIEDLQELFFLPYKRYPVTRRECYKEYGFMAETSNAPYLPFLCLPELKAWLLNSIHLESAADSKSKAFFYSNPFLRKINKDCISESLIELDIVEVYDYFPDDLLAALDTNREDLTKIVDVSYRILDKFLKVTSSYPDFVFDINEDGPIVELVMLSDIYSYRYKELIKYGKL